MSGGAGPFLQQLLAGQGSLIPGASGQGNPTMNGYGFNWYGGQPMTPEGGYYNQMAQMMAGPSYAQQGTNWYSGNSSQAAPPAQMSSPSRGPQLRPQPGGAKGARPFMGSPMLPGIY